MKAMSPSTIERVTATITKATGTSPNVRLDADTALIGAGISLDSSAVLELLVGLEKEFQIELNPDELVHAQALRTIQTLARFIDGKTSGPK